MHGNEGSVPVVAIANIIITAIPVRCPLTTAAPSCRTLSSMVGSRKITGYRKIGARSRTAGGQLQNIWRGIWGSRGKDTGLIDHTPARRSTHACSDCVITSISCIILNDQIRVSSISTYFFFQKYSTPKLLKTYSTFCYSNAIAFNNQWK